MSALVMRYAHVLCILCFGGCVAQTPYAVVNVEDPDGLAATAVQLVVTLDDGAARTVALGSHGFPVSFDLVTTTSRNATVAIEAQDASATPLARGVASLKIATGNKRTTSVVLSKPCDSDGVCSDNDLCNGIEVCDSGRCVAGASLTFDDGNPCTIDACDEASGITHVPANDLTACTTGAIAVGVCFSGACVQNVCGDHFVGSPEQCDDGANGNVCDGCDDSCRIIATYSCGDSYICNGEVCDNGSANSDASCTGCCRSNCQLEHCGDGIVDPGETCDDGNTLAFDGCTNCQPSERRLYLASNTQLTCDVTGDRLYRNAHFGVGLACYSSSDGSLQVAFTQTPQGTYDGSANGIVANAFDSTAESYALAPCAGSPPPALCVQKLDASPKPVGSPVQLSASGGYVAATMTPDDVLVVSSATTTNPVLQAYQTPSLTPLFDAFDSTGLLSLQGSATGVFSGLFNPTSTFRANVYATATGGLIGSATVSTIPNYLYSAFDVDTAGNVYDVAMVNAASPVMQLRVYNASGTVTYGPTTVNDNFVASTSSIGAIQCDDDSVCIVGFVQACALNPNSNCVCVHTFTLQAQSVGFTHLATTQIFQASSADVVAVRRLADGGSMILWEAYSETTELAVPLYALYVTHLNSSGAIVP